MAAISQQLLFPSILPSARNITINLKYYQEIRIYPNISGLIVIKLHLHVLILFPLAFCHRFLIYFMCLLAM